MQSPVRWRTAGRDFDFRLIGFLFRSLIDQLILRSFERVNQYFSGEMPGGRGGGDQARPTSLQQDSSGRTCFELPQK